MMRGGENWPITSGFEDGSGPQIKECALPLKLGY